MEPGGTGRATDPAPRLLVLGGTRYVGRAIATAALTAGWQVTTFNRGVSGSDLAGVETVHGDRYVLSEIEALARADDA